MRWSKTSSADEKGENFTEEDFNEKGFNADNNITEVSKISDLQNKLQSENFSQFFDDMVNKDFEYALKVKSKDTVNIFSMHAKEKEKDKENAKEKEKGFYVSIDESPFKAKKCGSCEVIPHRQVPVDDLQPVVAQWL